MSRRIAKKKTLFTVPDSPGEAPALLGGRCRCGHVFFPPQQLGCDVCGAAGDAIEIVELAGSGTLRTYATAHRQERPGSSAPLIFATVLLDDGPALEVVIDAEDEGTLAAGQKVFARLVPVGEDEDGHTLVDCFFAPEGAG